MDLPCEVGGYFEKHFTYIADSAFAARQRLDRLVAFYKRQVHGAYGASARSRTGSKVGKEKVPEWVTAARCRTRARMAFEPVLQPDGEKHTIRHAASEQSLKGLELSWTTVTIRRNDNNHDHG